MTDKPATQPGVVVTRTWLDRYPHADIFPARSIPDRRPVRPPAPPPADRANPLAPHADANRRTRIRVAVIESLLARHADEYQSLYASRLEAEGLS